MSVCIGLQYTSFFPSLANNISRKGIFPSASSSVLNYIACSGVGGSHIVMHCREPDHKSIVSTFLDFVWWNSRPSSHINVGHNRRQQRSHGCTAYRTILQTGKYVDLRQISPGGSVVFLSSVLSSSKRWEITSVIVTFVNRLTMLKLTSLFLFRVVSWIFWQSQWSS